INTLPVRVQLRPDESLGDLIDRVQAEQTALLDHQHLGLAELQRLAGAGDLFDTLVVVENYPIAPVELADDLIAAPVGARDAVAGDLVLTGGTSADATHSPLTIAVEPGAPGRPTTFAFEHHVDVLGADAVDAIAAQVVRALAAFAAEPGLLVGRF